MVQVVYYNTGGIYCSACSMVCFRWYSHNSVVQVVYSAYGIVWCRWYTA